MNRPWVTTPRIIPSQNRAKLPQRWPWNVHEITKNNKKIDLQFDSGKLFLSYWSIMMKTLKIWISLFGCLFVMNNSFNNPCLAWFIVTSAPVSCPISCICHLICIFDQIQEKNFKNSCFVYNKAPIHTNGNYLLNFSRRF